MTLRQPDEKVNLTLFFQHVLFKFLCLVMNAWSRLNYCITLGNSIEERISRLPTSAT